MIYRDMEILGDLLSVRILIVVRVEILVFWFKG